jgi:hypothetical protein
MSYNLLDGNTSVINGTSSQICSYLGCTSTCDSDDNNWVLVIAAIAALFLFSRPKHRKN